MIETGYEITGKYECRGVNTASHFLRAPFISVIEAKDSLNLNTTISVHTNMNTQTNYS